MSFATYVPRRPSPLRNEVTSDDESTQPAGGHKSYSSQQEAAREGRSLACKSRIPHRHHHRRLHPNDDATDDEARAAEILPGLIVGSTTLAASTKSLTALGISHMVSVVASNGMQFVPHANHLCVPLEAADTKAFVAALDSACVWMQDAVVAGGTVFVHSAQEPGRAIALVLAYLIMSEYCTLKGAISVVREKGIGVTMDHPLVKLLAIYEQDVESRDFCVRQLVHSVDSLSLISDGAQGL